MLYELPACGGFSTWGCGVVGSSTLLLLRPFSSFVIFVQAVQVVTSSNSVFPRSPTSFSARFSTAVLSKMPEPPQVIFNDLPDASQSHMEFKDTAWFRTHGLTRSFPSFDEVRAQTQASGPFYSRPVAKFEELDLVVKSGPHVTISEAVSLRAIKQMFSDQVPVPEIYGWSVDGQHVFIYMQLIRGPTLLERWTEMSQMDKQSVCGHLQAIIQALRSTKQDSSSQFTGE